MVSAGTSAAAAAAGDANSGRSAAIGGQRHSLSALRLLSSVLGYEMPWPQRTRNEERGQESVKRRGKAGVQELKLYEQLSRNRFGA